MTTFNLSRNLKLPVEAMTETIAILAQKGFGKTYTAMKLAEEMHKAGGQIVVLDPVGNWWCLRLAADGKKKWSDIPIFGGMHGDFGLSADKGSFIADVLIDHHTSAVLDVSTMLEAEKKRFVADLAQRLKFRKSKERDSVLHLFLEEAQEFVPQRPGPDETKMLGHLTRIAKLGRNWGIGLTMISQRPQAVNKEALNLASMLIVGCMVAKHDRKAIIDWVEEQGKAAMADEYLARMTKLSVGEMIVWSPSWLDHLSIVKISKKETYDASATPKLGGRKVKLQQPKPIDAKAIRAAMAETEEKIKSSDPKELQRRIRQLTFDKKQVEGKLFKAGIDNEKLMKRPTGPSKPVPYLGKGDVAELDRHLDRLSKVREHILELRNKVTGAEFKESGYVYPDDPPAVSRGKKHRIELRRLSTREETPRQGSIRRASQALKDREDQRVCDLLGVEDNGEIKLVGKSKLMLQHLVAHLPESYTKDQLAILVGMTAGTGGFNNYVGMLKKEGLITTGGRLKATDAGVEFLGGAPIGTPTTTEELVEMWLAAPKIVGKAKNILRLLVDRYPNTLTHAAIADHVGMVVGTGGFNNYLGVLKKAGLVKKTQEGFTASDALFP